MPLARSFQDEQHLGRLFLPVEGPLARALENRVDLFPGHVLMIINPNGNGRGRRHCDRRTHREGQDHDGVGSDESRASSARPRW